VNISISSIAWDKNYDPSVAKILVRYGVSYIDLTPTRYFGDIFKPSDSDILNIKNWWNDQGVKIYGMQSLLYGTRDFNIFNVTKHKEIFNYLNRVFYIASLLDIKRLVFGSPKNRDRSSLSDKEALHISVDFFYTIGELAKQFDLIVCLEPNPSIYDCNFMINHDETAFIINQIAHESIGLQLDTGAIAINKEDLINIIDNYSSLIKHIHLSEPMLLEIDINNEIHKTISSEIKKHFSEQIITIEMLTSKETDPLKSIQNSLAFVSSLYV
jgi:sugar phosphate isomerase/epimerase